MKNTYVDYNESGDTIIPQKYRRLTPGESITLQTLVAFHSKQSFEAAGGTQKNPDLWHSAVDILRAGQILTSKMEAIYIIKN